MEEDHTDSVLLARTAARENPSVEYASFAFEYRLVVADEALKLQWYRVVSIPWYALGLGGDLSYAVQRRRVDTSPSGQQLSEWINLHFAKTICQLLWECYELRNFDIQSCHPLCAFVRAAHTRVDEIDQTLSRLTEQGLREDFEGRFQQGTSRLRNQERIAIIRSALLQDFEQENVTYRSSAAHYRLNENGSFRALMRLPLWSREEPSPSPVRSNDAIGQ